MLKGRKVIDIIHDEGNENMAPLFHTYMKAENALKLYGPPPPESQGMRGLWIVGEPGSGKSHHARAMARKHFD